MPKNTFHPQLSKKLSLLYKSGLNSSIFNQAKLAQELGIKSPSIHGWTHIDVYGRGDRIPSSKLQSVAELFGVKPEWFSFSWEKFQSQIEELIHSPQQAAFHIPYHANPNFVGRKKQLDFLHNTLTNDDPNVIINQALTGMGGIGKTQLACEFAYLYRHEFPGGVFWLNFSDRENAVNSIAECGLPHLLNLFSEITDLEQQAKQVIKAFSGNVRCLLIFDNCEDPTLWQEWRPKIGNSAALITSRNQHWEKLNRITLDVLSRTESVELLRKYRSSKSNVTDSLFNIADALGDFPLALHLAGSFLNAYPHTDIGEYLTHLSEPHAVTHPSLSGRNRSKQNSPTFHEESLLNTFLLGFDRLSDGKIDDLSRELLFTLSDLAPGEPISEDFLCSWSYKAETELDLQDALSLLINLGLITRLNNSVIMHRLVHSFCLEKKVTLYQAEEIVGRQKKAVNWAIQFINKVFLTDHHHRHINLIPHVRYLLEHTENYLEKISLLSLLGEHEEELHSSTLAYSHFEKALTLCNLNPSTPVTLTIECLHNVGRTLASTNKTREGIGCHLQAIDIIEKCFPRDSLEIANGFQQIGRAYEILARGVSPEYKRYKSHFPTSVDWNAQHRSISDKFKEATFDEIHATLATGSQTVLNAKTRVQGKMSSLAAPLNTPSEINDEHEKASKLAVDCYERALEIYRNNKEDLKVAELEFHLSHFKLVLGEYEDAVVLIESSYHYICLNKSKNLKLQSKVYAELGLIHTLWRHDYAQSNYFHENALEANEAIYGAEHKTVFPILYRITSNYMFGAELDKGLMLSDKTLSLLHAQHESYENILNLADHYLLRSGLHISEVFTTMGCINKSNVSKNIFTISIAMDYFAKAKRYYLRLHDSPETIRWVNGLYSLYLKIQKSIELVESGDICAAITYCDKIFKVTKVMYVGPPHTVYLLYKEQIETLKSLVEQQPIPQSTDRTPDTNLV